jgi:flagellar basal-body rod protein FlgF
VDAHKGLIDNSHSHLFLIISRVSSVFGHLFGQRLPTSMARRMHCSKARGTYGQRILRTEHGLDCPNASVGYDRQQFGELQHNWVSSRAERLQFRSDGQWQCVHFNYGVLGETTLDMSQGAFQKTGNDLDLALQGPGFFVVQTKNGPVYTRNGAFQVSSKGQLITAAGDLVVGDKGAITMLPGPVSTSADGTISSNGAVTGRLKLVEFRPGTALKSSGGSYYTAPANTPVVATNSAVEQGELESSNVNPVSGMVELISAQRSDEMMQRAFSMFNSEIDKTATQDLPKVS